MDAAVSRFALDPSIDAGFLAAAFAREGRVQIAPFLAGDGAERLRAHLEAREDWRIVLKPEGERFFDYSRADFAAQPAARRQALERLCHPSAAAGFRYLYERIVAVDSERGPLEHGTLLAAFLAFLVSPPVLALLRSVTGAEEAGFADGQATRYGPGHFLTIHHDRKQGSRRLAAYVFGLTEGWRPEWGGLLLFHQPNGDVTRGLVPRMNALTLFAVPQDHSVSLVAPFAPQPRHSVTGWLLPAGEG